MDLRRAAAYFEGTSFDTWDEGTSTWTLGAITAKLAPVDRFLSNFHRPTHRRMLGINPATSLPASNTIRVQSTGDIYIIGQLRSDDKNDYEYDSIGIAHLTTFQLVVHRKAPIGPSNDPGVLIDSVVGTHYGDIEFRATSESPEQHEEYEDDVFLILPPHTDLQEWDFVYRGTETYQVKSAYIDSGFMFARAVLRQDYRRDFTYHRKGTGAGYNTATGIVTSGFVDYAVTGFSRNISEEEISYADMRPKQLKIVIKQDHIGFTPSIDDQMTWTDGLRYDVRGVRQDPASEEWQLLISL